jgi:PTH1 family peptidyl-tRNA hydrolase
VILIVGLGNPGKNYDGSKHNVGFAVIERFAHVHALGPSKIWKNSKIFTGLVYGTKVICAAPQTYMNLSGEAVGALLRYYKLSTKELIVVHDELDFSPGKLRLKQGGGHGGHNGLRSIIAHADKDFIRLRLGIGKPAKQDAGADHVLSGFKPGEKGLVEESMEKAVSALEMLVQDGIEAAMNRINQRELKEVPVQEAQTAESNLKEK